MDTISPEAARAAEEEAKRQAGTDASPVGGLAEAAAGVAEIAGDGTLGAVIEGVGAVLGGAVVLVGGVLGGIADI